MQYVIMYYINIHYINRNSKPGKKGVKTMVRYNYIRCKQDLYCKNEDIADLVNSVINAINCELTTQQSLNLNNNIKVFIYNNEELCENETYINNANQIEEFFSNWLDFADFDNAFEEICIHDSYVCDNDRDCEHCRFYYCCYKFQNVTRFNEECLDYWLHDPFSPVSNSWEWLVGSQSVLEFLTIAIDDDYNVSEIVENYVTERLIESNEYSLSDERLTEDTKSEIVGTLCTSILNYIKEYLVVMLDNDDSKRLHYLSLKEFIKNQFGV